MEPLIARSRKRGAVDMLTQGSYGNISRQWSRPFNHVEADPKFMKLGDELEEAIELVRKRFAKKFLAYYRKRMKEHNWSNHIIRLSCGMGSCSIEIGTRHKVNPDFKLLHKYPGYLRASMTCLCLLEEIEQSMDWSWASYLDGEILNGEK